jgi:hypothetical protein
MPTKRWQNETLKKKTTQNPRKQKKGRKAKPIVKSVFYIINIK